MNVSTFLKTIPNRKDGKILIIAIILSEVIFFINYIDELATTFGIKKAELFEEKWLSIWATLPFILTAFHIRKRIFSDTDINSKTSLLIETLFNFGAITYMALLNWNLL